MERRRALEAVHGVDVAVLVREDVLEHVGAAVGHAACMRICRGRERKKAGGQARQEKDGEQPERGRDPRRSMSAHTHAICSAAPDNDKGPQWQSHREWN